MTACEVCELFITIPWIGKTHFQLDHHFDLLENVLYDSDVKHTLYLNIILLCLVVM